MNETLGLWVSQWIHLSTKQVTDWKIKDGFTYVTYMSEDFYGSFLNYALVSPCNSFSHLLLTHLHFHLPLSYFPDFSQDKYMMVS